MMFPWLPIYRGEIKITQPSQDRKGNIAWKEFPNDVVLSIFEFLDDDDLFFCRGLNTQFYTAFYSQKDVVNCTRAIWLARKGRRFTNLRALGFFQDNNLTCPNYRALSRLNFPSLEGLWLEGGDIGCLGGHYYLRKLRFRANAADDLQWISDRRFPALETLIYAGFDNSENQVEHLPGHKSLTEFVFQTSKPSLEQIEELTNDKFPKLNTVGVHDIDVLAPQVLDLIKQKGFEFANHIEDF